MRTHLPEAFGFKNGQFVRMLVETTGSDEHDEEKTFPVGTTGVIDTIENFGGKQGIAFTVAIGGAITNVFDEGDGVPFSAVFAPLGLERGRALDVETYIAAATTHGENDDPDHEVGDLQDLLRAAFSVMTESQIQDVFFRHEVQNVLVSGSVLPDPDDADEGDAQ